MKIKLILPLLKKAGLLVLLSTLYPQLSTLFAQGTAFTYQGQLTENGSPAAGSYDLRFTVFESSGGPTLVAGPVTNSAAAVNNGSFTVTLDFGTGVFIGPPRWLEIAVRTNGNGSFNTLNPRQALLPTPYAVFANTSSNVVNGSVVKSLNGLRDAVTLTPGANVTITPSGNTLTIASAGAGGSGIWSVNSTNTYYNAGNVGIGTIGPLSKLHIVAAAGDPPPRLQSSGTTGFGGGWDFYQGDTGKGYVGVPDSAAAFGPGELLLFGGSGTSVSLWADQARAVTVVPNGNVGIGTISPSSKLDVRGNIKLGTSGQYFAPAGEENLRIMRGVVAFDASAPDGCCFSVTRPFTGTYDITFTTPFSGPPVVTATPNSSGITTGIIAPTSNGVRITTYLESSAANSGFHFIAVGPR